MYEYVSSFSTLNIIEMADIFGDDDEKNDTISPVSSRRLRFFFNICEMNASKNTRHSVPFGIQ